MILLTTYVVVVVAMLAASVIGLVLENRERRRHLKRWQLRDRFYFAMWQNNATDVL
jgi:hypothetical protein